MQEVTGFLRRKEHGALEKKTKRFMSASPSPCPAVDCCPYNFNEISGLPTMLNEKSQHRRSNQETRMTRSHPRPAFLLAHCRRFLSLLDLSRVPYADLHKETAP
jgi:hypothetical protein